jgi:cytochrome P450
MRIANEPVELGPHAIPKGTLIILSIYMTHMMPELYPEPRKFRPERWDKAPANPYGFMTFSAGARRCIGAEFAMMEMKIVLSILLQRFGLQLAANAKIDRRVRLTLFPKKGIPMTLGAPGQLPRRAGVRGNIHEMVDLS